MKIFRAGMHLKLLLISFLLSIHVYGQDNVRITLNSNKISIKNALLEVEKQSKMSVAYNESKLNGQKFIEININNESLSQALTKILEGTGFGFSFSNEHILITPKEDAVSARKITGTVRDKEGVVMPGVSVVLKGTILGTLTSEEGHYSITIPEGTANPVLVYTFIGYNELQEKPGSRSTINVVMLEEISKLEEVVVTALGIKRSQKALSYNVQEVKSEELTTIKDANFINTLAGKVAGLNITSSSAGIGGATRVIMRGVKSINKDNNALYVIDGVPIINFTRGKVDDGEYSSQPGSEGAADINPEDIESMSVLTGPAAAALYGSSAANGAILITTKKGKAGKAHVTVSNQTTFMEPFVMPEFQNSYGNAPGEYSSWGDKMEHSLGYEPKKFFNTGSNVQNAVTLSIGNDKNQTYASAATTNSRGIIPNNDYNRYNFLLRNTSSFLNDKMTLDFSLNYIIQNDQNMMAQGKYYNPLTAIYTLPRGESIDPIRIYERYDEGRRINVQYWPWGDQGLNMQNPYWITNRNIFNMDRKRYIINAGLKYDIFNWMNIAGRVRVDNSNGESSKKLYASTAILHAGGNKGFYSSSKMVEEQIYADVLLNINRSIVDFSISANIGASIQDINYDEASFEGRLKFMPNFFSFDNIDMSGNPIPKQDGWQQQTQSIFMNFEAGWRNMLYLTLTGRNDWDSALSKTPQPSFFYPSVGISGVISEMIKLPSIISYLKVRGSFASVGNTIPRHLSIPNYEFNRQTGKYNTNTYMPIGKLYPERTKSWEVGMDIRFWRNRFHLDVTYYKSNTSKQTIQVPISPSSGYTSIYAQTGDIQNKGLEGVLTFKNSWRDFRWESNFTANYNKNEIKDLGRYIDFTGEEIELDQIEKIGIGSAFIRLTKGGTLGDLWTRTVLKRDQEGNIWVDPNSGGLVIENKLQKAGSVLPKWNLGFRNDFGWKGINIGFLVTARIGGEVVSPTQAVLDSYGVSKASETARNNGGIPVNNGMIDAKTWYQAIGGDALLSHYIYSATNVRLQEASIGYTLPRKWFNHNLGINISLVGRNLLMIYNKAPFDPEATASTGNYYQGFDYFMQPSMRSIGFNLKVDF